MISTDFTRVLTMRRPKTLIYVGFYLVYEGSHNTDLQSQKYLFAAFALVDIVFVLLLTVFPYSPSQGAFAASP